MFPRMLERAHGRHDIGQGGGVERTVAEVRVQRLFERRAIFLQQRYAPVEPIDPLLGARRAVGEMRRALPSDHFQHVGHLLSLVCQADTASRSL